MAGISDRDQAECDRLKMRLNRERRARAEAESIAEHGMRELYEKQRELTLLQAIAVASNEALAVEGAMQVAVDQVCAYTGWPIGHFYRVDQGSSQEIVSTGVWHLDDPIQFHAFREATEATVLARGEGLPGRVLATGKSSWIKDVTRDSNFPRAHLAKNSGVHAGFAFPVLVGSEVAGVLEFFSDSAVEIDERLLVVMAYISAQLGRVVERERVQAMADSLQLSRAELNEVETQLIHSSKLASLGTLAAGVAHELNQPVAIVRGLAQQLLSEEDLSEEVRADLRLIEMQTTRMTKIILNLRIFSRSGFSDYKEVSVNQAVEDCLILIGAQLLTQGITVDLDLCNEAPPVLGDANELQQVLLNLITNARDAVDGQLDARIGIASRMDKDQFVLQIRDNGPGIPHDIAQRIFDPFFTTKEPGKGTGLGLSISHGIISKHRGGITVANDSGAVFTIVLPTVRSKAP